MIGVNDMNMDETPTYFFRDGIDELVGKLNTFTYSYTPPQTNKNFRPIYGHFNNGLWSFYGTAKPSELITIKPIPSHLRPYLVKQKCDNFTRCN